MPVMSPFTSAMNTGTPAWENPSASTLSVTVLPVPDAPAIRPWRLAWLSSRRTSLFSGSAPTPIQMAFSCSMASPITRDRAGRICYLAGITIQDALLTRGVAHPAQRFVEGGRTSETHRWPQPSVPLHAAATETSLHRGPSRGRGGNRSALRPVARLQRQPICVVAHRAAATPTKRPLPRALSKVRCGFR